MSEILCKWLNEDVKLSSHIEPENIAVAFSNGYLVGELLSRFGLQNDFPLFSPSTSSDVKLNNFTRMEPTMQLLDVKFDTNMAREIINETPGMATRLLYQLFIALGKKEKMNLTGVAMETMRPSGPAKLGYIESDMYKERLKTLVPRQVDLDFDELVAKYDQKQREQEKQALRLKMEEEEQTRREQQRLRQQGLQRSKEIRENQDNVMKKIRDATVEIMKEPLKKGGSEKQRAVSAKKREVQSVMRNIQSFENGLQQPKPPASPETAEQVRELRDKQPELTVAGGDSSSGKKMRVENFVKPQMNEQYIGKIRQRLSEDEHARKEREKRRRRVLVEQMRAHAAQEDAVREDHLVTRLMRQSQMERRVAVQLMHVRHQKTVVKANRLEQERQFVARRLKDFEDALAREAEACRQAKIEYAEEVTHQRAIHDELTREREHVKKEKHTAICREVLLDIIDFSLRVAEYRELTDRLLPPKLVREWKSLFLAAQPLYSAPRITMDESDEALALAEKQRILDEEDFLEYTHFVGEWQPEDAEQFQALTRNNDVLGFVVKRLQEIINPPTPPPDCPKFPAFPIKACVLGKFFAGKSSVVARIIETHRVESLSVDLLVQEAIESYKNKEMVEIPESEFPDAPTSLAGTPGGSMALPGAETPLGTSETAVAPANEDGKLPPAEDPAKVVPVIEPAVSPISTTVENKDNIDPMKSAVQSPIPTDIDPSIRDCESEMSIKIDESKMQLSARAKLGLKAGNHLKKGRVLPDALLVEVMVEAIRRVPEGTGWILDNFPINVVQAKMLEKALTGYEAATSPRKSAVPPKEQKKAKKSRLAQDPTPPVEVKQPVSGIDVVVLFDIDNDTVLKRAEGRTFDPETGETFHQEFNAPLEGTYTGLQNKSKVLPVLDSANDREQAQIRVATFQENWPKLEKWYNKFDILARIDVNRDEELVYVEAAHLLEDTLDRLMKPPTPPPEPEPEPEPVMEEPPPPPPQEPTPEPEPETPSKRGRGKSPKGGKGGKTPSKSPSKEGRASSKGKSKDGKGSPSPSRKGSAKGRRSKSPAKAASEDIIPETPPRPPSPEPGSKEWVWVQNDIDKELVDVLLKYWNNVEETYIAACKHVFLNIRDENETIYRYFFNTRKLFVEFLKRPDEKQEFVLHWQKEYNNFSEDMRSDEEAKSELHQRVDDMCDRLWDVCDARKEEAESERRALMKDGWLEDRVGLLTNHYISFMQAELDRYQQTCKLLRDYYVGMEAGTGPQKVKLITEGAPAFARVPLVELPPTGAPGEEPEIPLDESISVAQADEPAAPPKKRPTSSASKKSAKSKSRSPEPVEPPPIVEDGEKKRIPLVPRRPHSVEPSPSRQETSKREKKTTPKKDKSRGGGGGGMDTAPEVTTPVTPPPPADLDEKLLFDAHMTVLQVIEAQNAQDLADEEAEADVENKTDLSKTASKGKGKGKKSPATGRKSPAGKKSPRSKSKMAVVESATEVPETLSEEETQKKQLIHNMKKEYKTAVAMEGNGLKARIESIKARAADVILQLKTKAQASFDDMDEWLGKRFGEEMMSIEVMTRLVRQAIETEEKLEDACILEDKEFFVDDDLHIFMSPTPPPPAKPCEPSYRVWFTCVQLDTLIRQFKGVAPLGHLSIKAFMDQILDVPHVTLGMEYLPDVWMNISQDQLLELTRLLTVDGEYIDWRQFIISVLQPFPHPTVEELLQTRRDCLNTDRQRTAVISAEDYQKMHFWLEEYDHLNPVNDEECVQYDRMKHLKEVLFALFSREADGGPVLEYVTMLLYLCVSESRVSGMMRALSVVTGQLMPDEEELDALFVRDDNNIPQAKDEMLTVRIEDWVKVLESCRVMKPSTEHSATEQSFHEKITAVYTELTHDGAEVGIALPLTLVYRHPLMKDLLDGCNQYLAVDSQTVFHDQTSCSDEKTFI